MKRLSCLSAVLLLGLILGQAAIALGPNGTSGNITVLNANVSSGIATTGSTVAVTVHTMNPSNQYTGTEANQNTIGIQISGTFVATLTFQASYDEGSTWVSFPVVVAPIPTTGLTGVGVMTATSTGNWYANAAGITNFRVTATAYTSGTAVVVLEKATGAQLVSVQSMPALSAGSAAIGEVTAVGKAASGVAVSGNPVLVGGSDGTNARTLATDSSGRQVIVGAVADDGVIAGSPVPVGIKAVADAAQPTSVQAGDVGYSIGSIERIPYVATYHPNHVFCNVAVSTATTLTAVGGSCAAPGAGLSVYVTDITFGSSAASSTAADSFPTLKYGTGGTCGSGTTVFWTAMAAANTTVDAHLRTPIKIPANNEICWIHSVAGSKVVTLSGFIAP